jgi:protein O-mannosyl-transferase
VKRAALAVALALAVCGVFGRATGGGFLSLDDGIYVTGNPEVRAGLTAGGVRFAFTSFRGGPWHPLTWLSHMLDVELFGLDPAGHHATNVALHAATTAVLFLALAALTGAPWTSALAAALFGLHPLRAESVAWVAERKDVLAGLFFALALWAYAGYARRGGALRMAGVAVAMALGLMAKPSIVTLPFVLLLLDVWPLGRLDLFARPPPWRQLGGLVAEKLPLFLLAAAASVLSVVSQGAGGGVASAEEAPLAARLLNAVLAYGTYLRKTLWPSDLAVFYPYPRTFPWLSLAVAALLLGGVSALALAQLRRRPWLAVGWLWFLGVMVPMVGLVQVGGQALADRYSYLPSIGLCLIAAFGLGELAGRGPRARAAVVSASLLALAAGAALTWRQVGFWRDNATLYRHAYEVTDDNFLAATNLAWVLATSPDPALRDGSEAVRMAERAAELTAHRDAGVLDTLAAAYAEAGDFARAVVWQRWALRLAPPAERAEFEARLALYERGEPYREAARPVAEK